MSDKKLPKNWQIKTLGEVCVTTSGGTPSRGNKAYYNGSIPWVKSGELNKGVIYDTEEKITEEAIKNSSAKIFPKGTLLIALYGATIGKLAFLGVDAATNQAVCGIYQNENIDSKYLYNFLFNKKQDLVNQGIGGAQPNISQTILKKLEIPFPPLETQQAIVSKIEELFSELDKGIEDLKTAQQQLKTYRQSVLKWAFEGKLTEEWRKKQDVLNSVVDLLNNIKKDKLKLKTKPLSQITSDELDELFEIPKEWQWVRNQDYLFEVKDGTHDTPKYVNEGIPFITQKNIKEDGLNFNNVQYISKEDHENFYQRSNVSKGDILISMIGHYRGMTAIVENDKVFSIKNVGLFKFNNKYQYNKFSYYFYNSRIGLNIILKKSKGGAQPFIGLTELRNWPVIVCSLEEQHQIVQEIESRLSVADKMEESIAHSLLQAESLRQSILKKAFSGELV
ncbi:restriction endonuclease subunit S [uncultured Flavobacterium sp.]|uniref:restriction endonuclease subunit S n=1 Tax=uncultured Flavobacterium sp. TaxID=165435 RepID=UPI0030ED2CE5|tara:strand:- start:14077 stop:15423 length:1347 start_codon:yes stop_codon:yes gene_type:complete